MNKSNKDGKRKTMYKLIFLFKNVFFECHKHNWLSMNIRVFHTLYKLVKKMEISRFYTVTTIFNELQ